MRAAGKAFAVTAILVVLACAIWGDSATAGAALMAIGVVVYGHERDHADDAERVVKDAPRCGTCGTTLIGNDADAHAAGWRFATIHDEDPTWQCPPCSADEEEWLEGFRNPGAGFCGGLTKKAKPSVGEGVYVWTWANDIADLTLRRTDDLDTTTLIYVRRSDKVAHHEHLSGEDQARCLERAQEVVADPCWKNSPEVPQ